MSEHVTDIGGRSPSTLDHIKPSVARACNRCHARKVKCDMQIPRCGACQRQDVNCNITACVSYSYEAMDALRQRISELEIQLRLYQSEHVPNLNTFDSVGEDSERFDDNRRFGLPQADKFSSIAEEVGCLTFDRKHGFTTSTYVGSAAGSTFAKVFFSQLDLHSLEDRMTSLTASSSDIALTEPPPVLAALPPRRTAQFLLSSYIGNIHVWWPILRLPFVRTSFDLIYTSPRRCSAFQKFVVFIILALGSFESSKTTDYIRLLDICAPADYFESCIKFFGEIRLRRTVDTLQATLLICLWLMRTTTESASEDLWQLSRFAMSSALALGCHRNHPRVSIDSSERELRNRVWWCTYALERTIAVALGRTLSLRNQAIDTPYPKNTAEDALTEEEAKYAGTFNAKGVIPAVHLFRLTRILGDTLESVYIARPRMRPSLSLKATRQVSDGIRAELGRWEQEIDMYAPVGSKENKKLRIHHSLASLLLNRPSPSFPEPSQEIIHDCLLASKTAIRLWTELLDEKRLTISWNALHDVFLSSLSWLYCSWKISTDDEAMDMDTCAQSCLRLLEYICDEAKYSKRSLGLFDALTRVAVTTRQQQQQQQQQQQILPRGSLFTEGNPNVDLGLDLSLDQLLSNADWSYSMSGDSATDPWMRAFTSDIEKLQQEMLTQPP